MPRTVDDLLREARATLDRVTPEQASAELDDGALLIETAAGVRRRVVAGDVSVRSA